MNLLRQLARVWRRRSQRPPLPRRKHRARPPRAHLRHKGKVRARGPGLVKWRRVLAALAGPRPMRGHVIAYHGTPTAENARSICRDGFMAGTGNLLGDGIYTTKDLSTAKTYAGTGGVYLKCRVRLGRTCVWNGAMQSRYAAWCQRHGVQQDKSAMTAFLLRHGFQTLQSASTIVVLTPGYRNPTAWKRKSPLLRVLSIHRASDDRRIYV